MLLTSGDAEPHAFHWFFSDHEREWIGQKFLNADFSYIFNTLKERDSKVSWEDFQYLNRVDLRLQNISVHRDSLSPLKSFDFKADGISSVTVSLVFSCLISINNFKINVLLTVFKQFRNDQR